MQQLRAVAPSGQEQDKSARVVTPNSSLAQKSVEHVSACRAIVLLYSNHSGVQVQVDKLSTEGSTLIKSIPMNAQRIEDELHLTMIEALERADSIKADEVGVVTREAKEEDDDTAKESTRNVGKGGRAHPVLTVSSVPSSGRANGGHHRGQDVSDVINVGDVKRTRTSLPLHGPFSSSSVSISDDDMKSLAAIRHQRAIEFGQEVIAKEARRRCIANHTHRRMEAKRLLLKRFMCIKSANVVWTLDNLALPMLTHAWQWIMKSSFARRFVLHEFGAHAWTRLTSQRADSAARIELASCVSYGGYGKRYGKKHARPFQIYNAVYQCGGEWVTLMLLAGKSGAELDDIFLNPVATCDESTFEMVIRSMVSTVGSLDDYHVVNRLVGMFVSPPHDALISQWSISLLEHVVKNPESVPWLRVSTISERTDLVDSADDDEGLLCANEDGDVVGIKPAPKPKKGLPPIPSTPIETKKVKEVKGVKGKGNEFEIQMNEYAYPYDMQKDALSNLTRTKIFRVKWRHETSVRDMAQSGSRDTNEITSRRPRKRSKNSVVRALRKTTIPYILIHGMVCNNLLKEAQKQGWQYGYDFENKVLVSNKAIEKYTGSVEPKAQCGAKFATITSTYTLPRCV